LSLFLRCYEDNEGITILHIPPKKECVVFREAEAKMSRLQAVKKMFQTYDTDGRFLIYDFTVRKAV